EAICLKAMAARPEERYPTPRELAEDLEHWLADEPVRAYREPLAARALRWARRHKPLVAGLVGLVAAALLLGGGGLGWLQRQRAATAQAVEEDLQEVEVALQEDRRDDARQGLQRAQDRLGTHGLPSLRRRAQQLCAEADLVAHLEEARMRRASFRGVKRDYAGADRAYTEALAGHGIDL